MSPCFILDDHTLFAQAFALLIRSTGIFSSVLPTTFKELPALISEEGPRPWLFADYIIPGVNVREELRQLRRTGRNDTIVVLVSSVGNPYIIRNMLKEGCKGYLTKATDYEELATCINAIEGGNTYISKERHDVILQQAVSNRGDEIFTKREMEMLPFLANGATIEEIAGLMHISIHTAINHKRKMMAKTNAKSVTVLVKIAIEMGLV